MFTSSCHTPFSFTRPYEQPVAVRSTLSLTSCASGRRSDRPFDACTQLGSLYPSSSKKSCSTVRRIIGTVVVYALPCLARIAMPTLSHSYEMTIRGGDAATFRHTHATCLFYFEMKMGFKKGTLEPSRRHTTTCACGRRDLDTSVLVDAGLVDLQTDGCARRF